MNLFGKLFSVLNEMSVRYLVVGGIAVNLYGIERATADVDIVVDLERANVERFIIAAKRLGLKPKMPVKIEDLADVDKRTGWIAEKGMKVFSLYDVKNPFFLLDVLTEIPFNFCELYESREVVHFERTEIPLMSIGGLIRMKSLTGRPQDEADVHYLNKILKGLENEE
jgi:hypothetical protein